MVARTYNFTKQNGVVVKARKRFTKQNGVVKQILNGWTKQNGVVEKVYESVPSPVFATILSGEVTFGIIQYANYVDANYFYGEYLDGNALKYAVQQDYLSSGIITQVQFDTRLVGFNYAGGNTNEQSLICMYNYHPELLISDLFNPIGNFSTRQSNVYFPVKVSSGQYIGIKRTSSGGVYSYKVYRYSDTGATTDNLDVYGATHFSRSLTLTNGVGLGVGRQTSAQDPTLTQYEVAYRVYMYDYNNNPQTYSLYTAVVESVASGSLTGLGYYLGNIYTPNGQDCIFSINWNKTNNLHSKLCKFNIQTKTTTTVTLGYDRVVIGTYNGYIYVLTPSYVAGQQFVVEKYDLSLTLISTHTISLEADQSQMTADLCANCSATNHSGGRYCAVQFYNDGKSWVLYLDLSLF